MILDGPAQIMGGMYGHQSHGTNISQIGGGPASSRVPQTLRLCLIQQMEICFAARRVDTRREQLVARQPDSVMGMWSELTVGTGGRWCNSGHAATPFPPSEGIPIGRGDRNQLLRGSPDSGGYALVLASLRLAIALQSVKG